MERCAGLQDRTLSDDHPSLQELLARASSVATDGVVTRAVLKSREQREFAEGVDMLLKGQASPSLAVSALALAENMDLQPSPNSRRVSAEAEEGVISAFTVTPSMSEILTAEARADLERENATLREENVVLRQALQARRPHTAPRGWLRPNGHASPPPRAMILASAIIVGIVSLALTQNPEAARRAAAGAAATIAALLSLCCGKRLAAA